MRMDVDEWLKRHKRGEYWRVFLDGEDITQTGSVILADEERGYVEVYVKNEQGFKVIATVNGQRVPVKETRIGQVELRLDGQPVPEVTRAIRVRE